MNSAFNAAADPLVPVDPDQCRLTNNTNSDFNPRYSQDGKMIAFIQDNNVHTMKLDATGKCADPSGNSTKVTDNGNTDSFVGGFSPWEPNATDPNRKAWIVFQRNAGATHSFEVYKVQVNAAGAPVTVMGTETNVSNSPAFNDSQPSFCSDGSKIAFHSNRTGSSDIWVMKADGSEAVNKTFLSLAEESAPAYSGDCTKIAFQSDRAVFPRPGQPRNVEIYRMDDNGANVTRLSYNDYSGTGPGTDVTGFDLNPQWSPDGKRICFHSGRGGHRTSNGSSIIGQWDLYTLDTVEGEPHPDNPNAMAVATEQLTDRAGNDERCGWQETP